MKIVLGVLIAILAYILLSALRKWWKKTEEALWEEACMYDPEYDMWFSNHPLHPNYQPEKDKKKEKPIL